MSGRTWYWTEVRSWDQNKRKEAREKQIRGKDKLEEHDDEQIPCIFCDECSRIFKSEKSLRQHRRCKHPSKLPRCVYQDCGRRFLTVSALVQHKREAHGAGVLNTMQREIADLKSTNQQILQSLNDMRLLFLQDQLRHKKEIEDLKEAIQKRAT
eukprot:TRINITY_DN13046_c0_g1_i2.p1 TRINITY_DN13046_c0_g1~~TRINITY_DN13046_c0_g1_i2.p1  ORF type:complete len:154 (-),score=13.50 TRINITY_DN13046_c0_g1_i2:50-511(-)